MTLYFQDSGANGARFTVSVPNIGGGFWTLLLSSQYSKHLEPGSPTDNDPWNRIDLQIVETNDRYTTFQPANNVYYHQIRENFYNGVYNIKIGTDLATENPVYIYEGTAKLLTGASEDATKNIKKYESDDETNSGYVFYSDRL